MLNFVLLRSTSQPCDDLAINVLLIDCMYVYLQVPGSTKGYSIVKLADCDTKQ